MRIAGITIPDNKKLKVGLTAVYGIGRSRAEKILQKAGIEPGSKPANLSAENENKIRDIVQEFKIEGELRRLVGANIKRLKDIKAYRGIRHIKKLPVRGQRTRTNSRTVRGNVRKTMGSGRRRLEKT